MEGLLRELIWDRGRHRISIETLKNPKSRGRLSVPDFELYYLAAQLQWLAKWLKGDGWNELGLECTEHNMLRLRTGLLRRQPKGEMGQCAAGNSGGVLEVVGEAH